MFEKKFLFIPINKSNHWLLVVIVNPGHLPSYYCKGVGNPSVILLDSSPYLDYKVIMSNIHSWLNAEAVRLKKIQNIVDSKKKSLPMLTPEG